jgi:hypothetical protein
MSENAFNAPAVGHPTVGFAAHGMPQPCSARATRVPGQTEPVDCAGGQWENCGGRARGVSVVS